MITLEKYTVRKSRHECPQCGKKYCFTLYVDEDNNEPLADYVGRCDHQNSCGYHFTPKQYYQDTGITQPTFTPRRKRTKPEPSFIDFEIFERSCKNYESNNFISYLQSIFDQPVVDDLIQKFYIGTAKRWPGATVFWQIDINNHIRSGKIMLYSATTGKRVKGEQDYISWVHSALRLPNFNLEQCFFGEHQLKTYKRQTIGVVESEKTAIIASGFYPSYLWIATCGKKNKNLTRLSKILTDKKVLLFPDLDAIDIWEKLPFPICDLKPFAGKPKKYDLADLLTEDHAL